MTAVGDKRYADYVEYYRARARRVATNPLYPNAAAAALAMLTAIERAGSLEAFQSTVGDLPLRCATALARDQAEAKATLFAETDEAVRAQEPAEVLARLDAVTDVPGLTALANAAAQRAATATTIDSFMAAFGTSFTVLENIEVWQTAQVPDRWRAEVDGWVADAIRDARAGWQEVETAARAWEPMWTFDEDTLRERRHRRMLPYPEKVLDRRLAQHRSWVRGEA